jgi:hypothetical protein
MNHADVESEEKTAEDILSALSKNTNTKLGKVIFCIDTDSDTYEFGIIEKYMLSRLIQYVFGQFYFFLHY